MLRQVIALPARATLLDACEFFMLHRLLALPTVLAMTDVATLLYYLGLARWLLT
jgi:hypothetical protein